MKDQLVSIVAASVATTTTVGLRAWSAAHRRRPSRMSHLCPLIQGAAIVLWVWAIVVSTRERISGQIRDAERYQLTQLVDAGMGGHVSTLPRHGRGK